VHRDIAVGGAAVWIYCFVIFNKNFPGSMGVLSPPTATGGLLVPKRFWAVAHYSRFVRPGWKCVRVDGAGPASTAFVNSLGNRLTIVAINADGTDRSVVYHFGGWAVSSVDAYTTSQDEDLAAVAVQPNATSSLSITLAPRSITTLVGDLGQAPTAANPSNPNRKGG
jgi:hypothetical protein